MRAARRRSGALVLGGLLLAGTIATPLPAAAHAGAPRAATGSPAPDALSSPWISAGTPSTGPCGRRPSTRPPGTRTSAATSPRSACGRAPWRSWTRPAPPTGPSGATRRRSWAASSRCSPTTSRVTRACSSSAGSPRSTASRWAMPRSTDCTVSAATGCGTRAGRSTATAPPAAGPSRSMGVDRTPTQLVYGGYAGPGAMSHSTTGLTVVDRATGAMRIVAGDGCPNPLLPSIRSCLGSAPVEQDVLLRVRRCAGLRPGFNRVLVGYHYAVGNNPPLQDDAMASYDLTPGTGGRRWFRLTQVGPAARAGPSRRSDLCPDMSWSGDLPHRRRGDRRGVDQPAAVPRCRRWLHRAALEHVRRAGSVRPARSWARRPPARRTRRCRSRRSHPKGTRRSAGSPYPRCSVATASPAGRSPVRRSRPWTATSNWVAGCPTLSTRATRPRCSSARTPRSTSPAVTSRRGIPASRCASMLRHHLLR